MADATTAAPAGAAAMDLDMRLLWTVGAVGLYATGTLLKGLRKAWTSAEKTDASASATPAAEVAMLAEACDSSAAALETWNTDAIAD